MNTEPTTVAAPSTAAGLTATAAGDVPRGLLVTTGATLLALFAAYLGSSAPEGPDPTDVTAATAQSYFVGNATALEVAALFAVVAAVLLVVAGALLRRLVRTIRPGSALADVALAAACVLAIELWLYSAIAGVGDATDPAAVDPRMALDWYALKPVSETLGDSAHLFRALFVAAVALAAHQVRFLPRWLTVFGLTAAAFCALGELGGLTDGGGFVAMWFAGLAGFLLWLPLLGLVLLVRSRLAP